ncbi:Serine/arginine-rich SC35-like splicing factor SCL30A [Linum perenne]
MNTPPLYRPDDLRVAFGQFGPLKDIYLPRDYYTGEPRGFGFIQFVDPSDAADAKYNMDGEVLLGRELTVVFAEENRKKPSEMRARDRVRLRGRDSIDRRRSRSPRYRHSRRYSRSPAYYSPAPRSRRYSRSISPRDRKYRSISPQERSNRERSYSRSRSPYVERSRSPSRSQSPSYDN